MSCPGDIVPRLRAVLHNDRSVELMNREAANEIERLRAERDRALAERDDARREVCSRVSYPIRSMHLEPPQTMLEVAQERGWDCWRVPG